MNYNITLFSVKFAISSVYFPANRYWPVYILKVVRYACTPSNFTLQIHVNGFVSLEYPPYPSSQPYLYSPSWSIWRRGRRYDSTVIAPFWTDLDLRDNEGVVYIGHFSRSYAEEPVTPQAAEVFEAVRLLVLSGAGDTGFLPTEVVTVTWHNVSAYPAYRYYSYWYGYSYRYWYRPKVRVTYIHTYENL